MFVHQLHLSASLCPRLVLFCWFIIFNIYRQCWKLIICIMEYIVLTLGNYLIDYMVCQYLYTLIFVTLWSKFVNEKCLRMFFINLVRLCVCALLSRLNLCLRDSLGKLKDSSCRIKKCVKILSKFHRNAINDII